jgi:hypothetical protein
MYQQEYPVFKDEDQFFYSDGIVADNGIHCEIHLDNGGTKWANVMPMDLCTIACSRVGYILVE